MLCQKLYKLTITDAFLGRVYEKLSHLTPGVTDPMQCYLSVNDAVRRQNMERLFELTRSSAGAMLWNGGFMPLPRAAVRANFADHRTLYYNFIGGAGVPAFDHALVREPGQDVPGVRHVSYTDRAFDDARFRNKLCKIVGL